MYITQGLHRSLQQTPDRIATICGDRQRTFAELGDRVARFAGALQGLGVASGDRVAILSLNSDRYLEYLFAVPWADAVLNPINTRWSDQEVAYCLNDSDSRVLLVDDALAPHGARPPRAVPAARAPSSTPATAPRPTGCSPTRTWWPAATPIPDVRRGGDSLAGLFYTGGTTGFSKGVMLSHTNLVTSAMGCTATGEFVSAGRHLPARRADVPRRRPGRRLRRRAGRRHPRRSSPGSIRRRCWTPSRCTRSPTPCSCPTMIQMLVDHPDVAQYDLEQLPQPRLRRLGHRRGRARAHQEERCRTCGSCRPTG